MFRTRATPARRRGGRVLWGATLAIYAAYLAAVLAGAPATFVDRVQDAVYVAANLAYPVGGLVILAMIVAGFALARGWPGRDWAFIGAGMLLNVVADGLYLVQSAAGSYHEHSLSDVLFAGAVVCLAAASWQP